MAVASDDWLDRFRVVLGENRLSLSEIGALINLDGSAEQYHTFTSALSRLCRSKKYCDLPLHLRYRAEFVMPVMLLVGAQPSSSQSCFAMLWDELIKLSTAEGALRVFPADGRPAHLLRVCVIGINGDAPAASNIFNSRSHTAKLGCPFCSFEASAVPDLIGEDEVDSECEDIMDEWPESGPRWLKQSFRFMTGKQRRKMPEGALRRTAAS